MGLSSSYPQDSKNEINRMPSPYYKSFYFIVCLRIIVREIRAQQAGCAAICQSLLEVILQRLRRPAGQSDS